MKYKGQRAFRIVLRTIHLLSVMFLAGSVFGHGVVDRLPLAILVMSGGGLMADEFLRYGTDILRWASFWSIAAKIALLLFGGLYPAWMPEVMVAAVVIGGIISHAPGAIRQYAFVGQPGPCALKSDD